MCFAPKSPSPPPAPPPPRRADEENRGAVLNAIEDVRRRKGSASTYLTGGLGDPTFGGSVAKPVLLGN